MSDYTNPEHWKMVSIEVSDGLLKTRDLTIKLSQITAVAIRRVDMYIFQTSYSLSAKTYSDGVGVSIPGLVFLAISLYDMLRGYIELLHILMFLAGLGWVSYIWSATKKTWLVEVSTPSGIHLIYPAITTEMAAGLKTVLESAISEANLKA